jgi:hypothetical protein
MRLNYSTMMIAFVVLLATTLVQDAAAFVKGSATTRTRPSFAPIERHAEEPKKKAKKEPVDTCRKPELVSQLAEKLDLTKSDAEATLAAVLGTIQDVSSVVPILCIMYIYLCAMILTLLSTPLISL